LTAAAACSEVEGDLEEGVGLCPRAWVSSPELPEIVLVIFDDAEIETDLEGGREFKSGAILSSVVDDMICLVHNRSTKLATSAGGVAKAAYGESGGMNRKEAREIDAE
jgi:hypothetical protein